MAIGGVIGHPVDEQVHTALMQIGQQPIEVIESAKSRIDVAVIHDVISPVEHRRRVERRYPERVDTEPLQMVKVSSDPLQVAVPVAVRICE
jgi:hypothetical protein